MIKIYQQAELEQNINEVMSMEGPAAELRNQSYKLGYIIKKISYKSSFT